MSKELIANLQLPPDRFEASCYLHNIINCAGAALALLEHDDDELAAWRRGCEDSLPPRVRDPLEVLEDLEELVGPVGPSLYCDALEWIQCEIGLALDWSRPPREGDLDWLREIPG
jgi:hypothetical protein